MTIETKELVVADKSLDNFLRKCEQKNFKNNSSLDIMKFQWCLDTGGTWFATYVDGEIISFSGIHPWDHSRRHGCRILFRGVQLEPRKIGLNRHHMQSYGFYYHVPLQIEWAKKRSINPDNEYFYITTNTDYDMSGKMTRINKTFHHLEKTGIVKCLGVSEVFNVDQTTWELDQTKYNDIRARYPE